MQITGIGDQTTVDALRLMGIPGRVVADAAEAADALSAALEPETVVLIARETAEMIREQVDEAKGARRGFIVLELPSAEGETTQAEETARLVSQAIGIKI